jgi:threonylcarbamoyladenosine tRNA methylthiotransferase MtaB
MKKVAFHTLGCKLNFSESSSISRDFEDAGYAKVDFKDTPDVFIINTCSVTDNADKKCRKIVRDALKISPQALVGIIGCYAQLKPTEISEIPGVDAVLGASEKFELLDLIKDFSKKEKAVVYNQEIKEANTFNTSYSLNDRTRTFLKVQDGCNYNCTFCTIPLARGKSRSDTIDNIIKAAEEISAKGVKEIVLTGVNIGDFGIVNGKRKEQFIDLVKALDEVQGIERLRISSIEPNLLTDEVIEFVSTAKRFVPHFHIPLQSGNDELLKAMRRRYQRELYVDRVKKIKSLMPDSCIGVDVIVGFPGESEEHFKDTYEFINELDVSYLHVFTYSERDNTEAISMENSVPPGARHTRSKMMRSLSEKKKRFFYESQKGKTGTVLVESVTKDGFLTGHTENYIEVKLSGNERLINSFVEHELSNLNNDTIFQEA